MGSPSRGFGAVAQLGERCNGIAEVRGSIPLGSTIPDAMTLPTDRSDDPERP